MSLISNFHTIKKRFRSYDMKLELIYNKITSFKAHWPRCPRSWPMYGICCEQPLLHINEVHTIFQFQIYHGMDDNLLHLKIQYKKKLYNTSSYTSCRDSFFLFSVIVLIGHNELTFSSVIVFIVHKVLTLFDGFLGVICDYMW